MWHWNSHAVRVVQHKSLKFDIKRDEFPYIQMNPLNQGMGCSSESFVYPASSMSSLATANPMMTGLTQSNPMTMNQMSGSMMTASTMPRTVNTPGMVVPIPCSAIQQLMATGMASRCPIFPYLGSAPVIYDTNRQPWMVANLDMAMKCPFVRPIAMSYSHLAMPTMGQSMVDPEYMARCQMIANEQALLKPEVVCKSGTGPESVRQVFQDVAMQNRHAMNRWNQSQSLFWKDCK